MVEIVRLGDQPHESKDDMVVSSSETTETGSLKVSTIETWITIILSIY